MANIFVGLRGEKDIHALQLGRQCHLARLKYFTYACLEHPLASLLSISASLHLSITYLLTDRGYQRARFLQSWHTLLLYIVVLACDMH